jgi:hypothetical protein
MQVQVTQDAQFSPVMDLFVQLMENKRRPVRLCVRARGGSHRLPPGRFGQLLEHVPPESMRAVQSRNGLRSACGRRVITLESASPWLESQPLRIPFAAVVFNEVP